MRRLLIALVAGIVVTVPAAVGLFGNASFDSGFAQRRFVRARQDRHTEEQEPWRALSNGGFNHMPPTAQMDREHADAQIRRGRGGLADGVGDVVQF